MNKKLINIILLIFGIVIFLYGGIFLRDEAVKPIGGVCIGIGISLFGLTLSNLWQIHFRKTHPSETKLSDIEFSDERNTMIRNKAKAKVVDIIQWFIIGIAYVTMIIDAPLWTTAIIVGVFLLKHVLEIYLMNKYQKEY